ncbi:cyclohexanone monooxygenase [Tepidiforma thermophila]|uniref:Cyclohexanone monooxygenase n=2 Tax=Tepidiforma thermophila (strain KCTC 52669 / CGMCC 1.13589 / G233) TaxID=2761530 RepID=A0A2A9HG77_TEPT2|nr:NAD(P)/FAD-dependent oxidoreductase [Tepidiforma thermophila]PFG73819.1 cyclohexanone monooxygenase [Tepidiforma thermophila]
MQSTAPQLDALIVGAGFSGMYMLHEFLKRDFKVRLIDDGEGPGGTWDKNRYPGARVDSCIWVYQFTDPDLWMNYYFTEKYPGWKELQGYFRYVADRWNLWPHMSFGQRMTRATFDEHGQQWRVETSTGDTVTCRFLIMATGSTTTPIDPAKFFSGTSKYRGELYHSARWPRDKEVDDLKGKRVAVIGTGASGVQIIQEVGLVADELVVFQRTPNLALPMKQERYTRREYDALKPLFPGAMERTKQTFAGFDYDFIYKPWADMSQEERDRIMRFNWEMGGFWFWLAAPVDLVFDEDCNRAHYDFWRRETVKRIKKPELVELLAPSTPPHPFGVKRPCLEQWYWEIYNQDNVRLVDVNSQPIHEFTETGIRAGEEEFELDVVICAIGFDNNTGTMTAVDIVNSEGRTVRDVWNEEYIDYLGKMVPGFPNLFYTYGLHSPAAFLNGPTAGELEGDWVVHVISDITRRGITRIEPRLDVSKQWHQEILDAAAKTLFPKAKSWYMGANIPGKRPEMLQYPSGAPMYRQKLWDEVERGLSGFILGQPEAASVR